MEALYHDPKKGFFGWNNFVHKAFPEKTTKEIKDFWISQDDVTSMSPARRKGKRPRVIASSKNAQWDMDTAVLKNDASENDEYVFFLLAIDILSKVIYTVPLKALKGTDIVNA